MVVFIRQLTGIRFVAAAWVLLYHLQGPLGAIGVMSIPVLSDTIRVGRLGVDLFFALSGFILTYTYMTRLGPRMTGKGSIDFWWLRLARVYPVHFVMLNVAGLAVIAQAIVTGQSKDHPWLNPFDYAKNLLLVQEWGPHPDRGWNVVAWSLSMEWLAYIVFPFLVLLLFVLHKKVKTPVLLLAWVLILVPLLWRGSLTVDPYYTDLWGSVIRVLTEFTAGALTYVIVDRFLEPGTTDAAPRVERLATTISVAMPILIIAGATFLGRWSGAQTAATLNDPDAEPVPPFFHLWLVPLLIVWIGSLALSRRGQAKWLSADKVVLGGVISYSLYMTHLVWFGVWRAAMSAIHLSSGPLYAVSIVLAICIAFVIAYFMWRIVEEPCRKWMRKLAGARPVAPEESTADPSARTN